MATSVFKIIDAALRKLGVTMAGDQAAPELYASGVAALRSLLDGWSLESLMVPYVITEQFALSGSQTFYSMGTGGDWDTVRPEEIQYVRTLDAGGISRPVYPSTKGVLNQQSQVLAGFPSRYVVSRDARFQWVEFDKYPADTPYVLITSRKPFNAVALDDFSQVYAEDQAAEPIYPSGFTLTGIQAPIEFPTGYEAAIVYNLAVHLQPEYPGFDLPAGVVSLAAQSKARIKATNFDPKMLLADVGRMTSRSCAYDVEAGP